MTIRVYAPSSDTDWEGARRLVEAYAASLDLDLSFQNFADELEHLQTVYGGAWGAFVLAEDVDHAEAAHAPRGPGTEGGDPDSMPRRACLVGCVGVRLMVTGTATHPSGVAARGPRAVASSLSGEIKRLYVAPGARGRGVGRRLMEGVLSEAVRIGYGRVVLDTLPSMVEARALYAALGFTPIAPYRFSPVHGTTYFERQLR